MVKKLRKTPLKLLWDSGVTYAKLTNTSLREKYTPKAGEVIFHRDLLRLNIPKQNKQTKPLDVSPPKLVVSLVYTEDGKVESTGLTLENIAVHVPRVSTVDIARCGVMADIPRFHELPRRPSLLTNRGRGIAEIKLMPVVQQW